MEFWLILRQNAIFSLKCTFSPQKYDFWIESEITPLLLAEPHWVRDSQGGWNRERYWQRSTRPNFQPGKTHCLRSCFHFCVFFRSLPKLCDRRMCNFIGCICLTFLHCAFSNVFSNCLPVRMQSHTGCICLRNAFWSGRLLVK